MLFAHASHQQIDVIMQCLNSFANASGLIINFHKSKLCISSNVQPAVANALSSRCGIPLSSSVGTYLGVPILQKRKFARDYRYILEKIQLKLTAWKRSTLSMAGRCTLIKSVTSSIPCYTMQTLLLPKATCDAIDKLNRQFLWGSDSEMKKPHLVNWETVCLVREDGGLGIRSAWTNNRALVAKLGWRLLKEDTALWCQAFKSKYLRMKSLFDVEPVQNSSPIWRSILRCREVLRLGIRWRVGSGVNINFWTDVWVGDSSLQHSITGPVASEALTMPVAHLITPNREWNLDSLRNLLSEDVADEVRAVPLPTEVELEDELFWAGTSNGRFSTKSAFQLLQKQEMGGRTTASNWSWVWKLQSSERVRMFVWLVARNKILCNQVRYNRHLTDSPNCPRCGLAAESSIHILRDCQFARQIWCKLGVWAQDFFTLDTTPWIKKFAAVTSNHRGLGIPWACLFLSTVWLLWKDRNKLIFNNIHTPLLVLYSHIVQHAFYTSLAQSNAVCGQLRETRWVRWHPPEDGFLKLNTDGSLRQGSASAGGLIRDSNGNWLHGFLVNIGRATSLVAELWGLREGLKLCLSLGISRLIAEMDSSVAVQLILDNGNSGGQGAALVADIKTISGRFSSFDLRHTLRDGNAAADFLASLGHAACKGVTFLDSPPVGLQQILFGDRVGAMFPRA
ncbi:hypothetical protein SLE2022_006230 [Rubroshorea leprosula]